MPDYKQLELYIAPGCPHCPNMIKLASGLVKTGEIATLQIINIAFAVELAKRAGVRSVPTFRIGEMTSSGVHTREELSRLIETAHTDKGLADNFNDRFAQGLLDEVIEQIDSKPDLLSVLLGMMAEPETPLTSRIAITAIFEHYQGRQLLVELIPIICRHLQNPNQNIRIDMAYLLGLTLHASALDCLQALKKDAVSDVRETAIEAINSISGHLNQNI